MGKSIKIFLITVIVGLLAFYGGSYAFEHFHLLNFGGAGNQTKKNKTDEGIKTDSLKANNNISIVFTGTDKSGALSDVIMYVKYNLKTNKGAIISIPRDTWVDIPGVPHHKINAVYGSHENGVMMTMEAVGQLVGEPVDYYASVNFAAVENIIDILGGVEIDVERDLNYDDPAQDLHIHIKKGLQVLDGKKGLEFLRCRNAYADQDLGRIRAQQQFIHAFVKKLTSPSIIVKAGDLLEEMGNNIKTNVAPEVMTDYLLEVIKLKSEDIKTYTLPGAAKRTSAWYYYADEDKVAELVKQVNDEIEGKVQPETEVSPEGEQKVEEEPFEAAKISVEILNSTSTNNLAGKLKAEIAPDGYKIVRSGFGNDYGNRDTSVIIDHGNHDTAVKALQKRTGIETVERDKKTTAGCDISIVIGNDRAN